MDRNEQARREFKAQQDARRIQQMFAADYAAGKVGVIDRVGQAVSTGALVIWHPPHDMVFHVIEAAPVLDPRQPPGLIELTLTCRVPVTFAANQPVMSLIRIGSQQAPGHASLDEIKGQEQPAPAATATTEPASDEATELSDVESEPGSEPH